MTEKTKSGERRIKVYLWLQDLPICVRHPLTVYARRDGFKGRVRATLIIPAKAKAKRK